MILLLGLSFLADDTLRLCTALSLRFVVVVCLPVATTAPLPNGTRFRDLASKSRMVSLTSDLGLPLLVAFPPPLDKVGAIGGFAPGDFALEARDDCSFPLERPLDLEFCAPDLVGLGLIPFELKLLLSFASSFLGSEIGLGILDLVIEARLIVVLSVLLGPPLAENPEEGLSQQ